LAPTRKILGVEDPYLQSSAAPNYFADAWEAWLNLNGERGRTPDLGFALVVNSALARSQDQLHIHMGCLAPSARSALDAAVPRLAIGRMVADRASCSAPAFLGLPDRNGGFGTEGGPLPSEQRSSQRGGKRAYDGGPGKDRS
jgi:hypothetical protein